LNVTQKKLTVLLTLWWNARLSEWTNSCNNSFWQSWNKK